MESLEVGHNDIHEGVFPLLRLQHNIIYIVDLRLLF